MDHHSTYLPAQPLGANQDTARSHVTTPSHQQSPVLGQGNGHRLGYDDTLEHSQNPHQGSPMSPDSPPDVQPDVARQVRSPESLERTVKMTQGSIYPTPLLPSRYTGYMLEGGDPQGNNAHRRDVLTQMSAESPSGVHHTRDDRPQSHELHHILPFLQGRLPPPGYLFSKQTTNIPHHQEATAGHLSPESPSDPRHDGVDGGQSSSMQQYIQASLSSSYPPGLMFPKQIVSQPQSSSPGQTSHESSSPDLEQKFGQSNPEMVEVTQSNKLGQLPPFSLSTSHPSHYMFAKQAASNFHALQDLVSQELTSDPSQQVRQEAHVQRSQSHHSLPLQQPVSIAHTHTPGYGVDISRQISSPHQQFYHGAKLHERQSSQGDVQPTLSGFPPGYVLPGAKQAPNQVLNLSAESSQIRQDQLHQSADLDSLRGNQPTTVAYHPGSLQGTEPTRLHQQQSLESPGNTIADQHKKGLSTLDTNENQPTDLSHIHVHTGKSVASSIQGQALLHASSKDSFRLNKINQNDLGRATSGEVPQESLSLSEHQMAESDLSNGRTLTINREGGNPREIPSTGSDKAGQSLGTVTAKGLVEENDSLSPFDEEENDSSEDEDLEGQGATNAPPVDKGVTKSVPDGSNQRRDQLVTPWEQIVDIAATRREEAIERSSRGTAQNESITGGEKGPEDGQTVSSAATILPSEHPSLRNANVAGDGQAQGGLSLRDVGAMAQNVKPLKMDINITVDERWQEIMVESGFNGEHSRFAEFLLSFYKSHKKCSEMRPGGTEDSRYDERTGTQVQSCCSCECHGETHTGSPSAVGRESPGEIFPVADTNDTVAEEASSGNRRKGRQQKPRKRKVEETYLPYSQVPIYKSKQQKSTEPVGMVSFSEESSHESGMDDHASDLDFKPPGCQSSDDDLPLKFRKSKLRKRSVSKEPKSSYEYVMDNPSAPLKIKLKQMAKRDAVKAAAPSNRKPRKPAKPKKAVNVRPKRQAKAKAKAPPRKEGATRARRGRPPSQKPKPAEPPPPAAPPAAADRPRLRRKRGENPIVKVGWSELLRQYMCKLCHCESPCIVDITLHLFDCHMDSIGEYAKCLSNLEVTVGSQTATAFEFLAGRKFEDKPSKEEEPDIPKKLPPVSGILSSFLASQEFGGDSRIPAATSEMVMNALSQAVPPSSNAMAFLHGASPATVLNALSATGALPYLPGLAHPALGDGNLSAIHSGNFPSAIGRFSQDGHQLPAASTDSTVPMLNTAVSSQTASSASTETDTASSVENRQKTPEGFNETLVPFFQSEQKAVFYQSRFRKSGVDIEELSKALEIDEVFRVIESWVKIRSQCPRCKKIIRVSKRTNKHRCRGSDDKPIYVLCDVCGNHYQKEYFSLHYNRIHCQSLIPCHVCGKKFTPSSLPKHIYKHSNPPTAFKCGSCPKSFRFRMDLERHELVHRLDKPYLCPTCGRGFTQKSNMQYHMRQHTGEQPYKCDNCMKSFTHNVSLKNHLKKHHGIDLWAMGYTGGGRPKKEVNTGPTVMPSMPAP